MFDFQNFSLIMILSLSLCVSVGWMAVLNHNDWFIIQLAASAIRHTILHAFTALACCIIRNCSELKIWLTNVEVKTLAFRHILDWIAFSPAPPIGVTPSNPQILLQSPMSLPRSHPADQTPWPPCISSPEPALIRSNTWSWCV